MKDKTILTLNQGQVASYIAFHLIRFWPEPILPVDQILEAWSKITERDFDGDGWTELPNRELEDYIGTTLNANPSFRELIKEEKFNYPQFIKSVCFDIQAEIKELKE